MVSTMSDFRRITSSVLCIAAFTLFQPAMAGAPAPRAPAAGDMAPAALRRLSASYVKSAKSADRRRLVSYIESVQPAETKALAYFALGMGDYEAESYSSAAAQLKRGMAGAGPLADYASLYYARSLAEEEDFDAAAASLAAFDRRHAGSRLRGQAARLRAESLIRSGQAAQARRELLAKPPQLSEPVRLWLLARTHELAGDLLTAVKTYRRVYYEYPASDQAPESEKALSLLRGRLGARYPAAASGSRLKRADILFAAKKFREAARQYRLAVAGLRGAQLDHARVRAGAADYRGLRTTAAYNSLSGLKLSSAPSEAERLYYLGECARRKRRIREFRQRAEELGKRFPRSPWYEEALLSLGNFYLLRNEPLVSRKYYERLAREVPRGKHAALAHWKVCWRSYLDRDPRAPAWLEEHVRLYPRSVHAASALYWRARWAERAGEPGVARGLYAEVTKRFPHYYYGYQAEARLERLTTAESEAQPLGVRPSIPPPRRMAPKPGAPTQRILDRGELLFDLGLQAHAERELRSADYRRADAYWVGLELARQTSERGEHHRGLRYMKRYGFGYLRMPFDSMPREYWERLFPLPYARELRRRAAPHKLDPYLVAALIRQESEFDPRAKSRAGALGLMQILPRTGRMLARRVGIKQLPSRRLYDPDLSLRLGTLHFRSVLARFEGNLPYSLAAYNAGEHRVDGWLTWADFSEPGTFAESIPFTETRGYVQSVLRNAEVYRQLYGKEQAASSAWPLTAARR